VIACNSSVCSRPAPAQFLLEACRRVPLWPFAQCPCDELPFLKIRIRGNGALSVKRRHYCRRHLERARYSGNSHTKEHQKTMLRILGTVALLTIGGELPAFAQAAIQEPGAYAFYHPNADVLSANRPSVRSFYPMSAFASSTHHPSVRTRLRHHRE
jgi:hypothetical protein